MEKGKREVLKNEFPKDFKKRFPGMKRSPEHTLNNTRKKRLTKEKIAKRVRIRKVRKNESVSAWENRMRKNEYLKEAVIEKRLKGEKLVYKAQIECRDKQRRYRKQESRIVRVEFNEKYHDFLKYYGIILNYYSLKYGIMKCDLEICFAFYNNKIIDIERFNNVCILNYGSSSGVFNRFKKNNYVTQLVNTERFIFTGEFKPKKNINRYRLSLSITKVITNFYQIIAKLNTFERRYYRGIFPDSCEKEIIAMNAEIEEYLNGNKKQISLEDENIDNI